MYVQHFYKDKNSDIFGVSYASCGPTIVGGGWQESGQGVVVSPLHVGSVPAATLPLLLSFTRNTAYTTKRNNNDEIQYIQKKEGTQFPKD